MEFTQMNRIISGLEKKELLRDIIKNLGIQGDIKEIIAELKKEFGDEKVTTLIREARKATGLGQTRNLDNLPKMIADMKNLNTEQINQIITNLQCCIEELESKREHLTDTDKEIQFQEEVLQRMIQRGCKSCEKKAQERYIERLKNAKIS
jgi:FtsZ-binding cell division protein ZapB